MKYGILPGKITATSNGKYIIIGTIENQNTDSGFYLLKIKPNLVQDSFSTIKYHYDTLCPNPIQKAEYISLDSAKIAYSNLPKPVPVGSILPMTLKIYPNPTKSYLDFKFSGYGDSSVTFSMFDILGVEIRSYQYKTDKSGNLNARVDLPDVANSCYIVELTQAGQRLIQKVMIY